jgi:Short-chain alcohol dehydrogenase of unknown specificity
MKKLLFHFDTDSPASVFDVVVAYDGGADHVTQLAGVTPSNCKRLVEGAIYTRAPKDKKNTALFISGSDLAAGQRLLQAVRKTFFGDFRVSVMLDSNGCNTTAAAGVALITQQEPIAGKTAVVLGGTGPVGQRAAVLLAKAGASVRLSSRSLERAAGACALMKDRFGVSLKPMAVADEAATESALTGANIVFGAGKAGVQLVSAHHWQENPSIELMADVNTEPPLGFEGTDRMDKGTERHGKLIFGGSGIGAFKLQLHRSCIAQLFERNDQILEAEEVYAIARKML